MVLVALTGQLINKTQTPEEFIARLNALLLSTNTTAVVSAHDKKTGTVQFYVTGADAQAVVDFLMSMTPVDLELQLNLTFLFARRTLFMDSSHDVDLVEVSSNSVNVGAAAVAIGNVLAVLVALFVGKFTGLSKVSKQKRRWWRPPPKSMAEVADTSMITVSTGSPPEVPAPGAPGILQVPNSPNEGGDTNSDFDSIDDVTGAPGILQVPNSPNEGGDKDSDFDNIDSSSLDDDF